VDALFGVDARGRRLEVTMRNEAYETHAVRRLRLLAAPKPAGGRVLASPDGRFHPAVDLSAPLECRAAEGDCVAETRALDSRERVSLSDADDLAARETIELRFAAPAGPVGIVVGARQTILTTFVFYQTLAYLGRSAGDYLAMLERAGPAFAERAMGMARVLGGIDVEVAEGAGEWKAVGSFTEAGPIAGDVIVLPFAVSREGPLRVRLRLTKGLWRLDWLGLARLKPAVVPAALEPASVHRGDTPDAGALLSLRRGDNHLITLPGDEHRIAFELPQRPERHELFLESQGYYYEWMRGEWLAEEDPAMAALAFAEPREALRRLAGPFKTREAGLEQAFWSSRFRR
jgi:hypothetical protein